VVDLRRQRRSPALRSSRKIPDARVLDPARLRCQKRTNFTHGIKKPNNLPILLEKWTAYRIVHGLACYTSKIAAMMSWLTFHLLPLAYKIYAYLRLQSRSFPVDGKSQVRLHVLRLF
jgi:hypothetical protein